MAATELMTAGVARDIERSVGEADKKVSRPDGGEPSVTWERLSAQIRASKEELRRLEDQAVMKAKRAARVTDEVVHEHPYATMGVAAAVGVLLGMLIARR